MFWIGALLTSVLFWALMLLLAATLCSRSAQAADGDPVQVVPVGDQGAAVAVDVSQPAAAAGFFKNNWGKLLVGVGAAVYAADRAGFVDVSEAWDDVRGKDDESKSLDASGGTQTITAKPGTTIEINGDGNNVTINYEDGEDGE
jgi:hypothetical protein